MKAFIAATFITTMQKERIVAFPRQNGYFKASQCYVISTLLILLVCFLFYYVWRHPLTPGTLQGHISSTYTYVH